MKSFLGRDGRRELIAAVRAVEARSAAEIVITLRPWSGSQAVADLAWGLGAGALTLGLALFGPWLVPTPSLLLDPLLVGLVFFLLSRSIPAMRRRLTPPSVRAARVEQAAAAQFHEKRVHQTRGRTGILVHVSLLERAVAVVADLGVEEAVDEEAWEAACARLRAVVAGRGDASALAAAVEDLGDVLEAALPREIDDVNELPDEPCA